MDINDINGAAHNAEIAIAENWLCEYPATPQGKAAARAAIMGLIEANEELLRYAQDKLDRVMRGEWEPPAWAVGLITDGPTQEEAKKQVLRVERNLYNAYEWLDAFDLEWAREMKSRK